MSYFLSALIALVEFHILFLAHHLFGKWKDKEFRYPSGNNGGKSFSSRRESKVNNLKLNHIIEIYSKTFTEILGVFQNLQICDGNC